MNVRLKNDEVLRTAQQLQQRVSERFPHSSLARLATDVVQATKHASQVARNVQRPNWTLRILIFGGIVTMALMLVVIISKTNIRPDLGGISDFIQGTEAFTQTLMYAGAGVYFLFSLESRQKRQHILRFLHAIRSLAHIIDMHQLSKDPETLLAPRTASSPKRTMSNAELTRYLNYCTEMLALLSKVAAICVDGFHDAAAVDAASDVEDLIHGLSRTIWQKLMILDRINAREEA